MSAIVLAGGKSSRMGQDKALININGIPLLKQICLLAQESAESVYVITPKIELYQSILPNGCQLKKEIPLPGETFPHGPLVGFAQGLSHVTTEWVLLLACDLPYLTSSEVQKWAASLYNVSDEIIAVLPKQNNLWQPLSGFYRSGCLESLHQFIKEGGRSFQCWLQNHKVQELSINNPQVLFNCNTTEDLAKLQQQISSH